MEPTRAAFGVWSGGLFMHFGQKIEENRMERLMHSAYDQGVRTFMTADVYGLGAADTMLGHSLESLDRETFCMVGAVGHDYTAERDGPRGYPRFTNSNLRKSSEYRDYLLKATEESLERCKTDHFDLLLLHNPDYTGYSSEIVWKGMQELKEKGLTKKIGIAPGPANGFTLDMMMCFEKFGAMIDWAMIILNPFEPWPGSMLLDAAEKENISLITRVLDFGGIFHDDVKPGHNFPPSDHRVYRAKGWVESGCEKLDQLRGLADKHGLTMLQLAAVWNFNQKMVKTVVPTLIQESDENPYSKPIEDKLHEVANIPEIKLSDEELEFISGVGNNKGCMNLKGGNPNFKGDPVADGWPMNGELRQIAEKWGINPEQDIVAAH